ncbi:hypothetical protein INR49_018483 [Caranx melampygus]|nr:hypothetical protein INR49_018483 [Caranx melampygus]
MLYRSGDSWTRRPGSLLGAARGEEQAEPRNSRTVVWLQREEPGARWKDGDPSVKSEFSEVRQSLAGVS